MTAMFFLDFMKNSNFSMGVLRHAKRQILMYFCDVISLRAQVFIVSIQRGVYKNILNIFYVSVFVIWLYLQKAMYRPCNLDL